MSETKSKREELVKQVREAPQCPQCGSNRIKDKWVQKTEIIIVQPVPLEDWAKRLIKNRDRLHLVCGTLDELRFGNYAQLVLTCEDCGFTQTFNVPEEVPENADVSIPIDALQIWCRNGTACLDATPCGQLACPFKKEKGDMVAGIMKCHSYMLTLPASDWASAHQLPEEKKIFFR